jgi:hypothetical protein
VCWFRGYGEIECGRAGWKRVGDWRVLCVNACGRALPTANSSHLRGMGEVRRDSKGASNDTIIRFYKISPVAVLVEMIA